MSGTLSTTVGPAGNAMPDASQVSSGGIARILDGLQVTVPAASVPLLQMCLYDAVDEFCALSLIWRNTIPWSMAAGEGAVELVPEDEGARIGTVRLVTGILHYRIAPPALLCRGGGDLAAPAQGIAVVACRPRSLDDYVLPDNILADWAEALRDGASGRLFSQSGRPWSDAAAAKLHWTRFRSQVWLAKEAGRRNGDLPGPRFPYFAQGRQRRRGSAWASVTVASDIPAAVSSLPPDGGRF